MDGLQQEIRFRHEVGIKNRNEITTGTFHAGSERPGLVTNAIGPMEVADIQPGVSIFLGLSQRYIHSLIRRVVENLYLEEVPWIVETSDRVDEALHDVHLVEDGQLHGDRRERLELPNGSRLAVAALRNRAVALPACRRKAEYST